MNHMIHIELIEHSMVTVTDHGHDGANYKL